MTHPLNILVVGPHPDDQEIGMGATIAKFAAAGHNVLILDMTDGEPTPFGDPQTRAREAAEAARILGVPRRQLGLTNRRVEHTLAARHAVAAVIRQHQAQIIFCPHPEDAHPDHRAVTRIVEDARFDAKLTKTDIPGEPIYPKWLFYYFCSHLRAPFVPNFCIDVTGYEDTKRRAILAYESQFLRNPRNTGVETWLSAALVYFGSRIGARAAEPFYATEPLGLTDLSSLVLT
ncbi:MAG: bacillithiol biosynthesis deacetylase BshB1 [Planctomycetota bacterium]|nr:bacillithiol biosynthesis deacetylase BshB1 [Planctomycetota bacterium]